MKKSIPDGFRRIVLKRAGFIETNGPLYGRVDNGRFSLGIRVEDRHCNTNGICHGGMLTFLADLTQALGIFMQADAPRFLPTISLQTDFIAPAPMGSWVEGRAKVLRTTRSLIFSQGLLTADDTLVARISGIYKNPSDKSAELAPVRFADD